jgi:hypothetical protein
MSANCLTIWLYSSNCLCAFVTSLIHKKRYFLCDWPDLHTNQGLSFPYSLTELHIKSVASHQQYDKELTVATAVKLHSWASVSKLKNYIQFIHYLQ